MNQDYRNQEPGRLDCSSRNSWTGKYWPAIALLIALFSSPANAQEQDTHSRNRRIARVQKSAATAVHLLYEELKDFDRECFLIGTLNDEMGHYQTFTSNKSIAEIDNDVKWMFEQDSTTFTPDTIACQRITSYADAWGEEGTALLTVAMFKHDYPDLRAVRACRCLQCGSLNKLYGTKIVTNNNSDSICNHKDAIITPSEIELHSLPLAKVTAGYYNFDLSKSSFPVLSSGGDIGYRGVINRDKISTQAQKLSFLAGVFMRYKLPPGEDIPGAYSISIPNSVSTIALCADILREIGCKHVSCAYKFPHGDQIFFTPSAEVKRIEYLIFKVNMEMDKNRLAF